MAVKSFVNLVEMGKLYTENEVSKSPFVVVVV